MNRRLSYAEWGELVRRAQTGEEKAFEELYYASYDYLYTVCFKSGVPEEEIGDVLQDTYLKIFKNLGSINDPERFLPWASMIAKNMGRDRGRQRKNYYEHNDLMGDTSTEEEQGIDTLATDEMDPCYSPEAALDRAATSKIVSEMIAELPEGQRNCIILWCNGWSTSDIASELGIPEGTAKTKIFKAKKKIEKKTLEVEKRQGIRLHTVAPISFFIWSIRNIHRILDIAPADFSGIRSELMRRILRTGQDLQNQCGGKRKGNPVLGHCGRKSCCGVFSGSNRGRQSVIGVQGSAADAAERGRVDSTADTAERGCVDNTAVTADAAGGTAKHLRHLPGRTGGDRAGRLEPRQVHDHGANLQSCEYGDPHFRTADPSDRRSKRGTGSLFQYDG